MRIVLDTNVLVSGLLNPHGSPGRVLDLLAAGAVVLLYDDRIISEYREVLSRTRFAFDPADVAAPLAFIEGVGEAVVAPPLNVALKDPDDVPFLEVAVAAAAHALVTGNVRHFSPTRGQHDVQVYTPPGLLAGLFSAGDL